MMLQKKRTRQSDRNHSAGARPAVDRNADHSVAVDDEPVVQPTKTLTLCRDHHLVDGVAGAPFLQTVVRYVEDLMALLD